MSALPTNGATGATTAESPAKLGMVIFLATDAMGFGGLLLAYAVLRVRAAAWPDPAVRLDRTIAALLTFVLLASGGTMSAALTAARRDRVGVARRWLAATLGLGATFVLGQAAEFRALSSERHVGLTTDHAASLGYVIGGFHGMHVVAGLVALASVALRRSSSTERWRGGVEVAALYWQFVDLVWIVIFTALYLLPVASHG